MSTVGRAARVRRNSRVADVLVDENTAARGGIHISGATVTIGGDRGSRVASNRATVEGGCLCARVQLLLVCREVWSATFVVDPGSARPRGT